LFRDGCDATCPTAQEYPRLAPEKIAPAWAQRTKLFTEPSAIPLVANSRWTRDTAVQRYGAAANIGVIHLGLDHALFAPVPKDAARRLLGLPHDKTIVAMGAIDICDQWKGGRLFHETVKALHERDDVAVVLFGRSSEKIAATKAFGFVQDDRLMPIILSAADIFVSTGIAESFGQTLLEASACAVPVVAINVGGVPDVVVHGKTGLLVDRPSTKEILGAVESLIADPSARDALGRNGRARVEENFTLTHQADAWVEYFKRLC
jgi:glycosyltransferase involved in cell wall biosynthesis